jgi:hypothetical protein
MTDILLVEYAAVPTWCTTTGIEYHWKCAQLGGSSWLLNPATCWWQKGVQNKAATCKKTAQLHRHSKSWDWGVFVWLHRAVPYHRTFHDMHVGCLVICMSTIETSLWNVGDTKKYSDQSFDVGEPRPFHPFLASYEAHESNANVSVAWGYINVTAAIRNEVLSFSEKWVYWQRQDYTILRVPIR